MSGEEWKDRLADGIEIDDSLLLDDNGGGDAAQGRLVASTHCHFFKYFKVDQFLTTGLSKKIGARL